MCACVRLCAEVGHSVLWSALLSLDLLADLQNFQSSLFEAAARDESLLSFSWYLRPDEKLNFLIPAPVFDLNREEQEKRGEVMALLQHDWQTDLCSLPFSVTAAWWGRVTMETEPCECVSVCACVCERMELPSQSVSSACGKKRESYRVLWERKRTLTVSYVNSVLIRL